MAANNIIIAICNTNICGRLLKIINKIFTALFTLSFIFFEKDNLPFLKTFSEIKFADRFIKMSVS